jgi:predicted NAD-dependent protein-ADP-ribosyltransferase YbiA (DUF1768 family)
MKRANGNTESTTVCSMLESDQSVKEYEGFRFYSQSKETWKRAFSNFYGAPFLCNNRIYVTVEHFYQSEKFRLLGKESMVDSILRHNDSCLVVEEGKRLPKLKPELEGQRHLIGLEAKKLAIEYNKHIDPVQNDAWNLFGGTAESVMKQALLLKFTSNPELKALLLQTRGHYLSHLSRFRPSLALERSGRSAYKWGEMCTTPETLHTNADWESLEVRRLSDSGKVVVGQNRMGKLLMEIRDGMK